MVDIGFRDSLNLCDGLVNGCHFKSTHRFTPGVSDGGFIGNRPEMRDGPCAQLLLLRIHHGLSETHRIATQHRKKTLGVGVVSDPGQPGQDRCVVIGHAGDNPHVQAAGMFVDESGEFVAVCHGDPQGRRETLDDVINIVARRDRRTVCRRAIFLGNKFNHRMHVAHVGPLLPVENPARDSQLVSGETADVPSQFLKSRTERNQAGGGRRKECLLQGGAGRICVLAKGFGKHAHDGLEVDQNGLSRRCDNILMMQVGEIHQISEPQQLPSSTVVICGSSAVFESFVLHRSNPCVIAAVHNLREPEIQPLTVIRPLRHPRPQLGKEDFVSC